MATTAVRFGLNEGVKEELMKYSVGAIGAFTGFGISEFTAEFITTYAGLAEAKKTVTKILIRLMIFGAFVGASIIAPAGWITWILATTGLGSFAGIFLDVYEYFNPEGIKGSAQKAALSFSGGSFQGS